MFCTAYYAIGLYHISRKSWKTAEKFISKAINQKKQAPSFWYYRLGFVLGKQKKWLQAEPFLRKANEINPNNLKFKIRLGMSLEQTNRKKDAAELYNSMLDECLSDSAFYRMGKLFFSLSRWNAAENSCRFAINVNPHNAEYYVLLAKTLKKQGKNWQVIESLQIATKIDNNHFEWYADLGNELSLFSKYEEAKDAFLLALRLKPHDAELHYKYGFMLEKLGNSIESEYSYKSAMLYDKKLRAKNLGIGVFHQKNGYWLEAAKAYQRYTNEFPMNAELFYRAAYAFDQCHLWNDAIVLLHSALLLDPEQPDWHYRLGYIFERTKQYQEASEAYERAVLTRNKHTPYWYYRLGFVLSKLGKTNEACQFFINTKINGYEKYLDIIDDEQKIEKSVDYLFDLGELSEKNLQRIFDRNNPEAYYKLSSIYNKMGNLHKAVEMMRLAILHNEQHNQNWYYQLGLLLFQLGNLHESVIAFQNMRIFKLPYSIDINVYLKNNKLRTILQYNEYHDTLPIEDKFILYESFGGESISCNPYAIFKHIVDDEAFLDWVHIWVLDDVNKISKEYRLNPNLVICSRESDNYIRFLATSKYLINNSTFPSFFSRRKEQLYLNTWHGTPLKTIGKSMNSRFMEHKNGTRNLLQTTHLISPNMHTTKSLLDDFDIRGIYSGKIAEIGYPRVDLTLQIDNNKRKILLEKLNIIDDKPILFYAPTWRGTHNNISIDEEKISEALNRMSELNYNVIFRGHPLLTNLKLESLSYIQIAPNYIDTNEILSITDVLVTDYSSVFFDFIKTEKPIIFYCYDKEEYLNNRGMYFNIEDMHGKCVETIEQLSLLLNHSLNDLKTPLNSLNSSFCSYDDGNATSRAVDFFFNANNIFDINNNHLDKVSKKNLLFFGGPFMPNGITSSLINLLSCIDKDKYCIYLVIEPNAIQDFPERMELFKKLSKDIHIIPRVGLMNMNVDEKYTLDFVHNANCFSSEVFKNTYLNAHKREFKRIFGDSSFYSILNFEGYHKFWVGLLASSETNNSLIYLHNEMFSEWQMKFPYLEIIFNLYPSYAKLVSVSPTLNKVNRKELMCFEHKLEKFVSIPNIVNREYIEEKSTDLIDGDILDWLTGDTLFITIGRLSPEKDHQKLLYAFSKAQQYSPHIQLIIVGDGPLRGDLERLCSKLNLNKNVFFAGIRPNPFPILNKADCFILSSNHEGQPMVLLESLILNKQIIATDIPGNRGVLQGNGGILIKNDSESLATGLIDFIDGVRVKNNFDFNRYFEMALNQFYKEISIS